MTDLTTVKEPGADAALTAFTTEVQRTAAAVAAYIAQAAAAAANIGDVEPPVVALVEMAAGADGQIEELLRADGDLARTGPMAAEDLNTTDALVSGRLTVH